MLKKFLTMSSALAVVTILSGGIASAQDQPMEPEKKMERSGDCTKNEDCTPTMRKKRSSDMDQGEGNRKVSRSAWRYDSSKHRRSRHKDATFRFYFGGYYYPERYWDSPVVIYSPRGRVSCGEGRRIVDRSGFNRVRVIECSGRHYTYKARRHGDNFRVVLNSRNGRIVSVREF